VEWRAVCRPASFGFPILSSAVITLVTSFVKLSPVTSGVMRLYQQLHQEDPVLENDAGRRAFDQILGSPEFRLFVLDLDGVASPRRT
jgi:hypothetical protein